MSSRATSTRNRARGENARGRGVAREGGAVRGDGVRARVEDALHVDASERVFAAGMDLYARGLAKVASSYSWIFWVSSPSSGQAYQVDLLHGTCGCKGALGGRVCKHRVAAGAKYLEEE